MMLTEGEGTTVEGQVDISCIKRCYADVTITIECLVCGCSLKCDYNDNYFSYPKVGGEVVAYFYCGQCEAEMEMPVKIKSANIVVEYNSEGLVVL